MKKLSAILALVIAGVALATEPVSPHGPAVQGDVLEVKDVNTYTYLRLKTKDGETWAAIGKTPVKVGARVSIENAMVMDHFESKSLGKTFDKIVFGKLAGDLGQPGAGAGAPVPSAPDVRVPKAGGADARTVAEIVTRRSELKDKTVSVRGKVVKFNEAVMGKNWVHLRDGSGAQADGSNDILVTTSASTALGQVVTARGVVHVDKDFGAGYRYQVLLEEATLQK